jgi:hypothetical protein
MKVWMKWTKFNMGFKDITIGSDQRNDRCQPGYQGYNDDGIVDLHSCSRLKCIGELMLM